MGLLVHMLGLFLVFEGSLYVFHNGCTKLHSYQKWIRVPPSLNPDQHLFLVFLIIVTLAREMISHCGLTCISLLIDDVEHFFPILFVCPL
jgi:hypothetical protein